VGLAAGFDKNCELIVALEALGFGFVEVGTVTRHAQPGNPRPRIFRYPALQALVNRLGFNNMGVEQAVKTLERTPNTGIVVGINVGKSAVTPLEDAPQEYAEILSRVHPYGQYFAVNISSPNTRDLRRLHEPDRLAELFDAVQGALARANSKKPVFVKLSPDARDDDLAAAARLAASRGIGIIATNTTTSRVGLEGLENGGLSGAPLRRRSTDVVKLVRREVGAAVPIMGVGGVFDAQHAKEKMDAGANAVQILTGLIYRGPCIVQEIVDGLRRADAPSAEPLQHERKAMP
jgi:dihydroorotate dehydrogenase